MEINRKNKPTEIEKDTLKSSPADPVGEISSIIDAAMPDTTEDTTEMMMEAIPRRKLSFALSKVKGVPALSTFLK